MARLLYFLAGIIYCTSVQASSNDAYISARNQILSLPGSERIGSLNTAAFDTSNPAGRYLYNSVARTVGDHAPGFNLSADDLRTLKKTNPELYYEQQIVEVDQAGASAKKRLEQLYQIRQLTEQMHYDRLVRLASKHIVRALSDNGNWLSAIIEIHQLPDTAPPYPEPYDYSLFTMYSDMAFSLYAMRNYEEQLQYCGKLSLLLKDHMATDPHLYAKAYTCRIDAYIGMKNTEQARTVLNTLSQLAAGTDSVLIKLSLAVRQAGYEYAMHNYPGTFDFAEKAAKMIEQGQGEEKKFGFIVYMLMSAAQLEMGNEKNAAKYLGKMDASRQEVASKSVFENEALIIKARVAESLQDYQKAAEYYEEAISALAGKSGKTVNDIHLNALTRELDEKHLSYLKLQSQLHKKKSDNMTLLAVFSSVLVIASGFLIRRLLTHKRQLESFAQIDSLTGVSNRWYALQKISRKLNGFRRSDSICVAMLDVDNFKNINDVYGHSEGDQVLIDFARQFKYRFGEDDIVGRYGGEEFIIMMTDTSLEEAIQKIEDARQALSHTYKNSLQTELSVGFSCGLVQVLQKTDLTPVLSLCDSLLYQAKNEGKNRTYSRVFAAE